MSDKLYGLAAHFEEADDLMSAVKRTCSAGYSKLDAYSPFEIEGLSDAIGISKICFIAGLIGALGGFFMQYAIAKFNYPINVGGRPLNSWPPFIVIAFEMAILLAGLVGFIGMLMANGLPMPYHPMFNLSAFVKSASRDGFFLCIEAEDPQFDPAKTKSFLQELAPIEVFEIEK
jgi:hypothetical protein